MSTVIDLSERLTAAMAEGEHAEAGPLEAIPGVYQGMEFLRYARLDAASNSRLSRLVPPSTPAHLKAYMDAPPRETEALRIGHATHCAILEPDSFHARYVRRIEGDGRTKAVKEAREAQAADFPNHFALPANEYDITLKVRDAVWRHPKAASILERVAVTELSIVWRDPVTGVLVKGRPDGVVDDLEMVLDCKSTKCAAPGPFASSIRYWGYHRQGALYQDGVNVSGASIARHHVFIAYEKVEPFAVGVYRLDDASMASGRTELAPLLDLYGRCVESDQWPAYSEELEDIGIADAAASAFTVEVY